MTHSNEQYYSPSPSILGSSIASNGTELSTSKTQPTFNGSVPGEKSGIVVIWIDDVKYTAPIQPDGSYTFTPPVPLNEGLHNISIHAIKLSGLIGEPVLFTLHVDTTAPGAPLIEFALDDVGNNTGARFSNEKTDDRDPVLRGKAEPGSIVNIYEGSTLLGSVKADTYGSWELKVSLSDGSHALSATSTDKLGNTSEKSASFLLEIGDDAVTPPGSATVITHAVDDMGSNTGTVTSGGLTDDNTPELRGVAAAGSSVVVYYRLEGSNTWAGSAVATLSGENWSWTPSSALAWGKYEFQASTGVAPSTLFTLDIASPADILTRTRIDSVYDDVEPAIGYLSNYAITDDKTPTFRGSAEANSRITLRYSVENGSSHTVTIDVNSSGKWLWSPPSLATGNWTFEVQPQGHSSWTAPFNLTITDVNGFNPVIDYAWDDVGISTGERFSGATTDDNRPELRGRAESNSLVYLSYHLGDGDSTLVSFTAGADGRWRWTPDSALDQGSWTFIVQKAGQIAPKNFKLTIDANVDVLPTIDYAFDNEGSSTGNRSSGATTDDNTPTLHGSGPANSALTLRYQSGNGEYITETVLTDAEGHWNWTPEAALSNGYWNFEVQKAGQSDWSGFKLNIRPEHWNKYVLDFNDYATPDNFTNGGREWNINSDIQITSPQHLFNYIPDAGEHGGVILMPAMGGLHLKFKPWIVRNLLTAPTKASVDIINYTDKNQTIEYYVVFRNLKKDNFIATKNVTLSFLPHQTLTIIAEDLYGTVATRASEEIHEIVFGSGSFYLDNITYNKSTADTITPPPAAVEPVENIKYLEGSAKILDLTSHVEQKDILNTIDLTGSGDNKLIIDASAIEKYGEKELFIADDTLQFVVKGNHGDIVQLKDILPPGSQVSEWIHLEGTITVAGEQFEVYRHADGAELLVQQGVKVEWENEHLQIHADVNANDIVNDLANVAAINDSSVSLDVQTILSPSEEDLFGDDRQLPLTANDGEIKGIDLQDILPEDNNLSAWQHQDSNVIVAGMEYQVYPQGDDAERLIQQGVKTELM
ncbi:Ig-like domain-containing protein [Enterobacter ludwigii]